MGASIAVKGTSSKKMSNRELGMLVTFCSMGMLFGTLILSYMLARARAPVWPPIGVEPVPLGWASLSTAILLLSSYFVHVAYKALVLDRKEQFQKLWNAALLTGGAFIGLQFLLLRQLYDLGVKIDSHLFGSIIYTLVIFHALHIVSGILALGWIAWHRRRYDAQNSEAPKLVSWFWHFLDLVWVIMFVLIVWR